MLGVGQGDCGAHTMKKKVPAQLLGYQALPTRSVSPPVNQQNWLSRRGSGQLQPVGDGQQVGGATAMCSSMLLTHRSSRPLIYDTLVSCRWQPQAVTVGSSYRSDGPSGQA